MNKDYKVLLYLIVFFSILTALLFLFYQICSYTYNGVVTNDSYEKGLSYNQVFKNSAIQSSLNLKYNCYYKTLDKGQIRIYYSAEDQQGNYLVLKNIMFKITRSVTDKYDLLLKPSNSGNNVFYTDVFLDLGKWNIAISSLLDGVEIFYQEDIFIQ